MSDMISMGLNIFAGALILFGVLWGLIRGLRKTTSRLLFLMLTCTILLFVTVPIVKLVFKIPATITVEVNGVSSTEKLPLIEALTKILGNLIGGSFMNEHPQITELLLAFPVVLLSAFVYAILFWVLKLLLLPLNCLFTKLVFPVRKRRRQELFGFASLNDGPEYPSSDSSIDPLMEIYKKSESNSTQTQEKESIPVNTTPPHSTANISSNATVESDDSDDEVKTHVHVGGLNVPIADLTPKELSKKEQKKQAKLEKKRNRPKKRRLLGGLVGVLVGVVTTFSTMIPIYGVMQMLSDYKKITITHLTDEPMSLDSISDGIISDIVDGYEMSILGKVSKTIGLHHIGVAGFDRVTTIDIDGQKITLRKDLNSLVDTAIEADKLIGLYKTATENGIENISQEDLTALLNATESIVDKCSNTDFISAMSIYILPLAYDILIENDVKIVENEHVNELIIETIAQVAEEHEIDIFNELKSIVGVAKYLDDQKLLIKVINNDYSDILPTISNLEDSFADKLTTKLFSSKIIDTTLPNIMNIALTIVDDAINFGYVENDADKEQLKSAISQLLDNFIDTASTLSEDNSVYVTDKTLISLGSLLDTFQNSHLLHTDTYNNLVSYTIKQVRQNLANSIPTTFSTSINTQLLGNVQNVTNWKDEMTTIYDALQILRHNDYGIIGDKQEEPQLDNSIPKRSGYTFHFEMTEEVLENIGKALDKLEETVLFGNKVNISYNGNNYDSTTIVSVLSSFFDEMEIRLIEDSNKNSDTILDILNVMRVNLLKEEHLQPTEETPSTFWQDELKVIAKFADYVTDISESENFEINETLGQTLDTCAHNSIMLGNDSTLVIMEKLIGMIKDEFEDDGSELNTSIHSLLDSIQLTLKESATLNRLKENENFWSDEIHSIKALMDISDKASTISDIAGAKEIASDLDTVYTSTIIPPLSFNQVLASVFKEFKTENADGIDAEVNTLIDNINNDIITDTFTKFTKTDTEGNYNFWQVELEHISSLYDQVDKANSNLVNNLTSIGSTLDTITTEGTSTLRPSQLLTEQRMRNVLAGAIDPETNTNITDSFEGSTQTAVKTSLDNISNKLQDEDHSIESFELELTQLQKLANIDVKDSSENPLKGRLSTIGRTFDEIVGASTLIESSDIRNILSATIGDQKDQLSGSFTGNTATSVATVLGNVSTQLKNTENEISSFETELTQLQKLANIDVKDSTENPLKGRLSTIGRTFDEIVDDSIVIVSMDIRQILAATIIDEQSTLSSSFTGDKSPDTISAVLDTASKTLYNKDIAENAQAQIKTFEVELTHLQTLANIDVSNTNENSEGETELVEKLDNIGATLDSIVTGDNKSSLITNIDLRKILSSTISDNTTLLSSTGNDAVATTLTNVSTTLYDTSKTDDNQKVINSFKDELTQLQKLANIDVKDSSENPLKSRLSSIGGEFDKIVKGDQTNNIPASSLILEMDIRNILAESVADIKDSFGTGDFNNSIKTALGDISVNLSNEEIKIKSFSFEMDKLQTLATIDFTYTDGSATDGTLVALGTKLDGICYNTTTSGNITSYDEDNNSKIITRKIISKIVSSVFDSAKADVSDGETTTETAFNNLITAIQTNITSIATDDKVIKWTRELDYVGTLTKLNTNTTITLDNAVDTITSNLDLIAFNNNRTKYNDVIYNGKNIEGLYVVSNTVSSTTTYYNSVIITRSALKNMMSEIMDTIKIKNATENTDIITNEMIDNLTGKVNDSDTINELVYYNDFSSAFGDLKSVKDTMNNTVNSFDNIQNLASIQEDSMKSIDEMLSDFQNLKISGVLTTRKIAKLCADEILLVLNDLDENHLISSTSHAFIENLVDYYSDGIEAQSTDPENYNNTVNTDDYSTPFLKFYEKLQDDLPDIPGV